MKILFLDDDELRWKKFRAQNPDSDATLASNYHVATRLVQENKYDVAYLDHDLEFYQPTGADFVNYLIDNKIKIDKLICHSMNPVGRANMVAKLYGTGYNAINMPHAWEYGVNNVLKLF